MNPDVTKYELTSFRGAMPRLDPEAIPSSNGLVSQNIAYLRGQAGTRYGHSQAMTGTDFASVLYNWIYQQSTPQNGLVWFKPGTGARLIDLNNQGLGIFTIAAQASAQGASFCGIGIRLFIAFYDANGIGTGVAQVYSNAGVDPLFAAPTQITFSSATEPSSGANTAGLHRLGFLLQTRNGFTTSWCPVNSSNIFTPYTGYTASGGKNLRLVVNGAGATWPAYASQGQVIMTTAANLNRYFIVPGAVWTIAGGTTTAYTVPDISISDADLTSTATDAVNFQNLLTQDQSSNPPFRPSVIFPYGFRIGYVTKDSAGVPVCYFSSPNAYQGINAANNGVYLPGNLVITTGFAMRGVSYLLGPHWTYAVQDNGDIPVNWSPPQIVDGSIGTMAPQGVWVNEAQGYAWVGDEGGLYLFEGASFPSKPISYYQQPDWNRINWSVPTCVQVIDDKNNKRVSVLAALDANTTPSHRLTWDYTDGTDPESAKYSIDNLANYASGAIALVQNPTSFRMELWVAPSSSGIFLRQNNGSETNPYRDLNTAGTTPQAINSQYETALVPGLDDPRRGQIHFHHGDHLRVRGNGNLALQVFGLDHVRSVTPAASPLVLSASAGLELLFKYFLQSEYASVQLGTNAVDAFFILSGMKHYYSQGAPQR